MTFDSSDSYITRKSMLYKTKVDYLLDENSEPVNDYAMNHVLGCSHGCKYPCYAFMMAKRFGQVEDYEDWCRPKLVENTAELLAEELRVKKDIKRVHMCFTTDPFPYQDWSIVEPPHVPDNFVVALWSLQIAKIVNQKGIPVTFLTKGTLPDVNTRGNVRCRFRNEHEIWKANGWNKKEAHTLHFLGAACGNLGEEQALATFGFLNEDAWETALLEGELHPDNYYGISLVSLNENFREAWEPGTAPYAERIKSLKALHDAGCKTWVSMEPFPALSSKGYIDLYGRDKLPNLEPIIHNNVVSGLMMDALGGHDELNLEMYDALLAVLHSVLFVDRIVFGRWNYSKNMPTEVEDVNAWYKGAAQVVRDFCAHHKKECIIKKGVE